MPIKTLSSFNLRNLWPDKWGASGKLVVCLDRQIVVDGTHYLKTANEGRHYNSLGAHWKSDITVVSNQASAGAISGLPVTDEALPAHTAHYNIYVYDSKGVLREKLNSKPYHLHSNLNDTFTWEEWVNANEFVQFRGQNVFIADRQTVQAMIDAVLTRLFPLAQGRATLVDGTATVSSTLVQAGSNVHVTSLDENVTGVLRVRESDITPGVGFTITSSQPGEQGVVAWVLYEA